MRLIKLTFSITTLFILIGLLSCDRITQPIPTKVGGLNWDLFPNGDSTNYTWPTWTANSNILQNVLIEDYTGHTCTNCPAAAVVAKNIEDANPGRVFVASIHAGTASTFQAPEPPEFPMDFRTEEGNIYINEIPSFFANPVGTINRQSNGLGNTLWYTSTSWANETNAALTNTVKAGIQVQTNFFPQTRGLFIHTESEFLTNLSVEHDIVIYLIRKTVISAQKMANGTTEENYHHHNVMSGTINGAWGTRLGDNISAGDKIYNDFAMELPNSANDTTYNIDNLSLITYIYNKDTYEIIQALETEL
ncbi:MAG: Omp28-related outer membrane protein [Flavobacteriales bacterium]|jgi:hypothetical protein|nr:Omp28-related outer membrane protein [Flavobacteriales bacterium]